MTVAAPTPSPPTPAIPLGVTCARLTGVGLGAYLLVSVLANLFTSGEDPTPGHILKNSFMVLFALLLILPWRRITDPHIWNKLFVLLVVTTVVFVFTLIFETLSNYMAMVEAGEKPGLPAFQGTLIFLGFLQVPSVLFVHKPELLD